LSKSIEALFENLGVHSLLTVLTHEHCGKLSVALYLFLRLIQLIPK